jgi:hypothetical protein
MGIDVDPAGLAVVACTHRLVLPSTDVMRS